MKRLVLCACVLLQPAALAAQDSPAHRLIEDDIEFARALARFRFFDLAVDVLDEIKARKLDSELQGTVIATEADIHYRQSQGLADDAQRLEALGRALSALEDWAKPGTAFAFHPARNSALEDLWKVQRERGLLRARQATTAGDASEADPLRTLAAADFKAATETLVLLQREYGKLAEQQASEEREDEALATRDLAVLTIYFRGIVLLDWAGVERDPAFRLEEAIDALTEFQWELDEEKLTQYYAVHYQGVAARKLGQLDDASGLQNEVIERGQWYWDNMRVDPESGERNPSVAPFVSELMDRAWSELALLRLESGDSEGALATVDAMFVAHERGQEPFSTAGFEVLMGLADGLAAGGRGGKAAEIVKHVAEKAPPGTAVREVAGRRLGEMVADDALGGGDESAAVLMAAADGLFSDRRFADAAHTWGRALAALRDESERKAHLFDAWYGIGQALANERRHLEAALAYEKALEAALALGRDEDTQKAAAFRMYNAYDSRFKETASDFDKKLRDAASDRLIKLGVGEDLQFFKAREVFDAAVLARPQEAALYLEALDEFRAVPATAPNHERALVYAARALAGAGRADEALAAFDDFLTMADDKANAPINATARARRDVSLGECLYYKADQLLSEGVARPTDALATLAGFEEKLPGQTGLIESVKYQRVVAHAALSQVEEGRAAFDDLKAYNPSGKYVSLAAFRMSDALYKASLAARDADPGAADGLLRAAADFMWMHCELAGFPSFANLVNSGAWFARAGDQDLALRSFQKAIDLFGEDPAVPVEQKDSARTGLATALNAAKEFNRARPWWQDLLKRNARSPAVMTGAARCFGGWLEAAADGTIVEVTGSGDYADAQKLWSDLAQGASARKYQRDWWEARLGAIYALYREGSINADRFADARKVLDSLRVLLPNYDGDTVGNLAPEQQYQDLLKPYFKYLEKKIPQR